MSYADELIEKDETDVSALIDKRPEDISRTELLRFLHGLPRRYLSMFDYAHVRLARNIQPDEVHAALEKKGDIWELTVVTLDKPFLFSNVSGVLSYFGMDILRGQAMTTPDGLVLDLFQFTDAEGIPAAHNAIARGNPQNAAGRRGRPERHHEAPAAERTGHPSEAAAATAAAGRLF